MPHVRRSGRSAVKKALYPRFGAVLGRSAVKKEMNLRFGAALGRGAVEKEMYLRVGEHLSNDDLLDGTRRIPHCRPRD